MTGLGGTLRWRAGVVRITTRCSSSSSSSSARWLRRQRSDPFVQQANQLGYRARSAFKILEIDKKHGILRPGMAVVECGAAPGAWTQVAAAAINAGGAYRPNGRAGVLVGCDLLTVDPVPGAKVLSRADFTKGETQDRILSLLGRKADAVLSDMAPNATGSGTSLDSDAQLTLAAKALRFAVLNSAQGPKTVFLCKVFDGPSLPGFLRALERFYDKVERCKPKSSRKESSELFVLARGFKGAEKVAEEGQDQS